MAENRSQILYFDDWTSMYGGYTLSAGSTGRSYYLTENRDLEGPLENLIKAGYLRKVGANINGPIYVFESKIQSHLLPESDGKGFIIATLDGVDIQQISAPADAMGVVMSSPKTSEVFS